MSFLLKNAIMNFTTRTSSRSLNLSRYNFSSNNEPDKKLALIDPFRHLRDKSKEAYLEMVNVYKAKEIHGRGHVEFIYSALKYMKEFGLEKDLEIYKALIDVLPKGKMIPRNLFQVEFMHYPKQQQCAIDLLEQMEENGVIPDWNMEDQLINVFGRKGYPVRRYWRMMYWMPKFKNSSPWPVPDQLPTDIYELAHLAIERICRVDITSKISMFKTSEVEDSLDETWIVSGQSDGQREIISRLPNLTPVYVEGGFRIWIKNKAVTYFILRVDPTKENKEEEINFDDISHLKMPLFSKPDHQITRRKSVHEQADGIILAVCATGTSSRDSLLSWVRILQKSNPRLLDMTVLFPMKSPVGEVLPIEELTQETKTISSGTKIVNDAAIRENKV